MTNCYWIEEQGAFEVCNDASLPEGWVRFDSQPAIIPGRDFSIASWQFPLSARSAYGNGLIVTACQYLLGVEVSPGSSETYTVFISDDGGFTYGPCIEKWPWLPGTVSRGYDAWAWASGQRHYGTGISFDGTDFYVVSNTMNDMAGRAPAMCTSKSSDGENWTRNVTANGDYNVSNADSYDGDIWFVGDNSGFFPGFSWPQAAAGHSSDDGVTWTYVLLGVPEDVMVDATDDTFSFISANSTGAHIAVLVSEPGITGEFGVKYFRPTSLNTWAPGVLIWDFLEYYPFNTVYGYGKLLASRITPSVIYSVAADFTLADDYIYIRFRRSVDAGVTWEPEISPWGALNYDLLWSVDGDRPVIDLCELDDGRLVLVFLLRADFWPLPDPDELYLSYVVSSDNGATFSAKVDVPNLPWDDTAFSFESERFWAIAMGNDVLVTMSQYFQGVNEGGRNVIFRP